jgi:hypothetical protein
MRSSIWEKNHLNATSVVGRSLRGVVLIDTCVFTLEKDRDPLSVTSVEKHLGIRVIFFNIRVFIQEKNHSNVTNVIRHFLIRVGLADINALMQEKDILNVTSVIVLL